MNEAAPHRELEDRLGHQFGAPALLAVALTHRSVAGEGPNNETLEFLGDAVLDLAVSDLLMRRHPDAREGVLSKLRAALVNAATLAEKARGLGLGPLLRLGKGEERSGGREKESILAAAYEAVLGAVYQDAGYEVARAVVGRAFAGDVAADVAAGSGDYKTRLQELTQRRHRVSPQYELVREEGPDHAKRFLVRLTVGGRVLGEGAGASKKAAEQAAAMAALAAIEDEDGTPSG